MNNKKVQAQMQIDVSFIGNTTKLVKELQSSFKSIDLSSNLTKQFEAGVSKGFKDLLSNLDKMSEGLSKKGLSTKQYTNFFDTMNTKIQESTKFLGGLKDKLTDIYSSEENKKAIKDLEDYRKKLEEINKLASAQKASTTRQSTAIKKMEDETGVQYSISKRMLANINARKQNKQDLTANQKEWMSLNGLDEKKLARVLELYKQITTQRNKIEGQNEAAKKLTGQSTVSSSSDFLTKQIGKTEGNVLSTESYKQAVTQLSSFEGKITQLTNTTDTFGKKFNDEVMPKAQQEAEKSAQGMQTLNEVLSQFGIALSATTIVKAFKDMAEAAFDFYKSLDGALNEIYIVSNLSIDAVNSLKTNFISMARDTGMALDDITRSAVLFYQQGLNTDEVLEMTEVTSQFAKVAGIDATDAADKLTAAVNGYCLAAEDASLVADKFNKVAAASAADINELSTAFSKAAAQANQAGVSMDNYLAYIATMEEATREAPENIGTSLKTIFSRMQQVKEGGTTEDGDTDVNDVETALKSVGIQLRDTKGELRDLEDVFDELGPKWQSLDRNTQAYLGTIIAGTRQQSRFITLMQNWDRVLDLSEQSADSAGQQALMHAKAMESIESKLQQFQVAWQEFISNLTDSDFFKGIIETMTKFIGSINSGATPVALMGTAIALLVKNITKLDGPLGKLISKFSGGLGKLKSFNSATLKMATNYIKNQKSIKQYTSAIKANEKEISKLEKTNKKLNSQMKGIQNATGLNHKQLMGLTDGGKYADETYQKLSTDIEKNTVVMNLNKQSIIDSRNSINNIVPELDAQKEAYDNVTDSLTNISIGLAGLSAILPGTLGSIAAAGSGITTTFNAAVQGVKLFSTTSIASIKAMSAAEKASVILTLISIGVQAVMGVVTAIKALGEAFGNQDKNIAESVESMTDALEKYNNAATTAKAAKNLIKDYQELANKVYLTTSEQEKLNDIAQQLGDSLELEVIEDEYGNLSISIQDATDKMEALNKKAKEAREELIKNEQEQIEKYDHNGNVGKFYEEYLATNRSDIRTAIEDIETGIDDEDLATSASNVEAIMKNLKNVIIDNSAEMSEAFGGLGIKWSLTEDVQSMIDTFNNADIDASQWNSLYQTFDVLQDRIDSLSYDEALKVVQGAIESWGKAAGLTTQELKIMTDAIMDSLYSDSNLNKTISKYQDKIDKADGVSYSNQEELYNKQLEELKKESTTFWNPFKQDEAEKEYESVQKKLRLLKEEKQAYENFKTIQDQINQGEEYGTDIYGYRVNLEEEQNRLMEEYGFSTTQELEKAIKMRDILKQFGDSSAAFFDNVGLFDEDAEGLLEQLQNNGGLSNILGAFKIDEESGTRELTTQLVNIIQNSDDTELKEAAENKLSNVFKNIKVSGTISWGDLSDTLDDASDDLRKMNNLMEEFADTGGFTLDTFADLCDILDSLDLSTIFDTGMMNQYLNALDNLKLGFDAATGTITANGDALKSLQDIEEVATKAKIEQTIKSLETDKAALQSTIYGIEAEMAANKVLIEYLKTQGDAEVAIDELKQRGQVAYSNTMQQAATLTAQQYHSMASASSSWAEAAITNAAKVGDALKAAMSGQLGSGNLSAYLSQLVSDIKYADTGSMGELQVIQDKNGNVKAKDAIAALEAYNVKGQNSINNILSQMKEIDQMIGLLNNMKDADLSKLGTDKEDSKEIEKYIGQLKEIYNILNRIQLLEHRLSTLDTYADISEGEKYGELLQQRLSYNEQLLDQYSFLVSEQKQYTNGYKDFINSIEGLEGVFDFDDFGQIIINFDKYTQLQDEAIDGEITLKQKADDVYNTYTEMFEELQGYFDEYITYLKQVIDLQQEMVDKYIEMQNKAADAVKEIYQKILDTRLDAIDQEKEALEELRDAREKARKDQENAKTISGLQTNIQRAMMDSSGASDISFIKAQQDMNDKLEDIADDKYSEELDNIINRLDEERDSLQEQFDELFDNLEWLFEWLDEEVMRDDSRLTDLLTQTSEWATSSQLQRSALLQEWDTNYNTYMAGLQGGKTIYDVWNNIGETKNRIAELDASLVNNMSKNSQSIVQTIQGWQTNVTSAINSAVNNAKTNSGGGGNNNTTNTTNNTIKNYSDTTTNNSTTYTITLYDGYSSSSYKKVKAGDSVTLPTLTRSGYKFTGWDIPSKGLCSSGAFTYKPTKSETVTATWTAVKTNGYITPAMSSTNKFGYTGGLPTLTKQYATGGIADFTGPAWLDGTSSKPEAVLNALQTEHFIKFTDTLDKLFAGGNVANTTSSVSIDTISFNVESMSSAEDGEAAFNAFVDKFKEIGSQSGIKIDSFKNRL